MKPSDSPIFSTSPVTTLVTSRRAVLAGAAALGLGNLLKGPAVLAQSPGAVMPLRYKLSYGSKALKVHSKAAIISYPILFMRSATAQAGNLGLYIEMAGPTVADMKALAAEAHDDLARQLAGAGYGMISGQEAARHPDIASMGVVPGNGKWVSGVPDPYGQRAWYITSAEQAPLFDRLGTFDMRYENGLPWALRHASRELGAMLVLPRLVFDFSTAGGDTRSGSQGSTAWVGGKIQFMVKATSIGIMWSGGPRAIEIVSSAFYPSNRDAVSPWPLLGKVTTVDRPIPPQAGPVPKRARYDVFEVDVDNWREQVRAAYRGYHKAMMDVVIANKGG